jgi:excisionase family DNA binding protein
MQSAVSDDARILYKQIEAARVLGVCDKQVYLLRKAGHLPFVMVGNSPRYPRAGLLAYVEKNLTPATA